MDTPHGLITFRLGVATRNRPGDQTGDTVRGARLGLGIDLGQAIRSELGDVEKDVLARVYAHGPWRKVIFVKLLAELHGFQASDAARFIQGVIVIQREIVFLLLVDRDPEPLGVPNHRRVPVGDEIKELDRVDVLLIVEQELTCLVRLLARLAGEAVKGHDMVPDSRARRELEIILDHGLLDVLVHEVQHALIRRLHAVIEGAAA